VQRREFIKIIAGSALTRPLAAHAQQGERVRHVGALIARPAADPEATEGVVAVAEGLARLTNWPDATNRPTVAGSILTWIGPPSGGASTASDVQQSVTLTPSGGLRLSTPGQVVSGLDISGAVAITANNVTLRRCRITTNATAVVYIANDVTGAVVEDCYIDGVGTCTFRYGGFGIRGLGTFRRNNIVRVGNGWAAKGSGQTSIFADNWVHSMLSLGTPHYDCIQIDGGNANMTISHNNMVNDHSQTSVVMIDNYFGNVLNVVVDNNRLIGGGYPCYYDAEQNLSNTMTGVSYTNNRLGIGVGYGYTYFALGTPTFTGNVDDATGAAITLGSLPAMADGNFILDHPASVGTVVGTLSMVNLPAPAHCIVKANDPNGYFAIGSDTGTITVAVSPPIGVYHPIIRAHSPRGWVEAYANITVRRAV
jgi:hypothetical protein